MKQNAYDNQVFFDGYKNLRESGSGLNDALEQPAIRSLLPTLYGRDVLDLGCGMGQFTAYCAIEDANRVVGVDISEKMLQYARYVADYEGLVQNVFQWLRPGGRFVYSCEHPVVTAKSPGCGNWVKDTNGQKLHWSVDNYGDEGKREQTWFIDGIIKYHRKLWTLLNGLIDHGFSDERVMEPEATTEALEQRPNLVEERRRPPVLVISAIKS